MTVSNNNESENSPVKNATILPIPKVICTCLIHLMIFLDYQDLYFLEEFNYKQFIYITNYKIEFIKINNSRE